MLTACINAALRKAHYEILPEGEGYFGRIESLEGVWAQADTLEACREELREVLEECALIEIRRSDWNSSPPHLLYCCYKIGSFVGPDKYVTVSRQFEDHLILCVEHEKLALPAVFEKLKPVLPDTRFVAKVVGRDRIAPQFSPRKYPTEGLLPRTTASV